VLVLIARGASNADIARIFSKLDLHDRAQAVVLAYETGLVQPGERG
jgi:DNA-binding NarL/FixJ family response regulator